ncbi:hypothetical protein BGZ54_002877 [Gamsiella multidivaricata]|nr:hypothetical protein BGZ54_002877 [Gamsiella multidivaricata]
MYTAPPGPWRQALALIGGFFLLLIFAPSGTSSSARQRTKRVQFNSTEITRNNGGECVHDDKRRTWSVAATTAGAEKAFNSRTSAEVDPSKWKKLAAPHSILTNEPIGERGDSPETQQQDDTYTDEDATGSDYDRWYVLEGVLKQGADFEFRITFPIEVSCSCQSFEMNINGIQSIGQELNWIY